MSTRVQWRRGNTAQTATFTGAVAEITVDTDKNVVVVHDGVTAGGHPTPTIEFTQSAYDKANASYNAVNTLSQSALTNGSYTFSLNSDGTITVPTAGGGIDAGRIQSASSKDLELNAGGAVFNFGYDNTLTFPDGSKQSTAYKGLVFDTANAAFNTANGAFNGANTAYSAAQAANDYAGIADNKAQNAWNKANTDLIVAQGAYNTANLKFNTSGGTITGDVTIQGQANVEQRLAVGTGAYTILPNLISQFTGSSDLYSQINQQNLRGNGSGDIVITADNGTDLINFFDMGLAGSTYDNTGYNAYPFSQPNDAWLIMSGNTAANFGGNVTIGTSGSGSYADIVFVQGSSYTESARFKNGQGLVVTNDVNANTFTTNKYIDFVGQSSNPSSGEGRVWYSNGEHALKQYTETGLDIDLGKQTVTRVFNDSGVSIAKGSAVRVTGGESVDVPHVALAKADTYNHIDALLGAAGETIANGSYGYVVTSGPVTGIDTSLVPAGSIVYVSNTTAGGYTPDDISPSQGFAAHLGMCLISDATNGVIQVALKGIEWGANFTNGAVAYSNGFRLYEDPTKFFYDGTNHRLGLGTDSPSHTLHVIGDAYFGGDVTITGNLTAANFQSVATSTLTVSGNTIILNDGTTGSPTSNATLLVNRGSSTNTYVKWNEAIDQWVVFDGTNEGYMLDTSRVFTTWNTYDSASTYKKSNYPVGADLANATNNLATTANTTAVAALSAAIAADNKAQLAFDKANTGGVQSITANSSARITQSNTTGAVTFDLATSGVTGGTYSYPSLQVDSYGRVTSISNQTPVTSFNGRTGSVSLSSSDVTTALTYTPVNKAGDTMSGALTGVTNLGSQTLTVNTSGFVTSNTYTTSGSITTFIVDSFSSTTYRSAKYLVQVSGSSGYNVVELLLVHDGTTVTMTQYGELATLNSLGSYNADISGGLVRLIFTPAFAVVMTIKVVRTSIVV